MSNQYLISVIQNTKSYNVIVTQQYKNYTVIVNEDVNIIQVENITDVTGTITVGPQGPAGPKGDSGIAGPQGIQGIAGPQGLRGFQGPAGTTGANGANGIDGINGEDGLSAYEIAVNNGAFVGTELEFAQMLVSINGKAPYTPFKFVQKGFGNIDLETDQIGDVFSGFSNDGTIRITEGEWLGGALNDSNNFKPLVQTLRE